jgi:CheY-like chemotaxis protein
MSDLGIKTTPSYHNNRSRRRLDSYKPEYYDEIITKLNLRAKEEYKCSMHQRMREQEAINQVKIKRILVVDDEPDICMVYQMVLEDAGYQCISYTDPVKALQQFRPNYYHLIILDIKMPILNGFEFCKKITELDRTVHIVFITASEEYYEKFRSQHFPELGKINYIQKPVGNDELVQIVNTIVTNSITVD